MKEDTKLKEVYEQFYQNGTQYVSSANAQAKLTSHEIKIKTKQYLVQGLEFADLLALGTKLDVLHTYGKIPQLTSNFSKVIIETIQPKYYRGPAGAKGNGKKFL